MKKLLVLSTLMTSFNLLAFNIGLENIPQNIKILDGEKYDFEGIVKLSNCSGSLVQLAGQPDSAPAIIMTNGHCIQKAGGYLNPGEVWANRPLKRSMKIFDKNKKLVKVNSTQILYATMTDTDVAYYELDETYADIKQKGIEPYLLDTNRPFIGMNIDIVSGYWDRGYRCFIDAFAFELLEGEWTFVDSIRYSDTGCDTIGGTSGSPIIQTDTRVVVGVNNTGNKDGGFCTINNPCERDDEGQINVMKRSYGQQTYNVYTCLTPDFKIDLTQKDCELPK